MNELSLINGMRTSENGKQYFWSTIIYQNFKKQSKITESISHMPLREALGKWFSIQQPLIHTEHPEFKKKGTSANLGLADLNLKIIHHL